MNVWETYVTQNPMKAETRRSFRRFFGLGKVRKQSVRVGIWILSIVYLFLLVAVLLEGSNIGPELFVYFEAFLLPFISVVGFYSSISGERERRTWEVLRALPVTRGQIVVGKYMGSVVVLTVAWGLLLPFSLITAALYAPTYETMPNMGTRIDLTFLAGLVPYITSLLALAVTLLFSARCKSSLSALSISLGSLFGWMVVLPILASSLIPSGGGDSNVDWTITMNPFLIIAQILDKMRVTDRLANAGPITALWPFFAFTVFCLVFATIFVAWTEKTLGFIEDKVDFVRRKSNA